MDTSVLNHFTEGLTWEALWSVTVAVLPVWVFGAIVGLLLPRPKWLSGGSRSTTLLLSTPPGTYIRKLALLFHAVVILREIWKHFTHPGTFRGLACASLDWMCGRGFAFQWPSFVVDGTASCDQLEMHGATATSQSWYVEEKDLAFFKYHAVENGPCEGASDWEVMMDKDIPNFVRYTSWRRTLPNGKTEYKSVTISPDATAEEFTDLYFDDAFRHNWDGMVIHHEVLEHGNFAERQQVVRWIRRFPFAFLSDREYTIARRLFKDKDGVYGLTKAVDDHPNEVKSSKVVKMDVFHSMWRSRNVECPWGSGKTACETILLHHEQFKIPENLARFAVRHGMWGFVRKLASTVPVYVAERRQRCSPNEFDAQAYGYDAVPNPPMRKGSLGSASSMSLSSMCTDSGDSVSEVGTSGAVAGNGFVRTSARMGGRMRGIAALGIACGVALLVGGPVSVPSSSAAKGSRRAARQLKRAQSLQRISSVQSFPIFELADEQ